MPIGIEIVTGGTLETHEVPMATHSHTLVKETPLHLYNSNWRVVIDSGTDWAEDSAAACWIICIYFRVCLCKSNISSIAAWAQCV